MNLDRRKWQLLHTVKLPGSVVLIAQPVQGEHQCPHCNKPHVRKQSFGVRWSEFVGLPLAGKPVLVVVKRNRYKCLECGRTFLQPMNGVDQKHRLHENAIAYIHEQVSYQTHSAIARELGVDSKTVFNVVVDWINQRESEYRPDAPRCMGIAETELMGRRRVLVTDWQTGNLVDLLATRSRNSIRTALSRLQESEATDIVYTAPWSGYRAALGEIMPRAHLVAEPSHILGCVRRCLRRCLWTVYNGMNSGDRHRFEKDRLILSAREDCFIRNQHLPPYWSSRFPLLEAAFAITQSFYTIYDAEGREEAEERYAVWVATMPKPLISPFDLILTLLRCWHLEIFRHFDLPKHISCPSRNSPIDRIHEQVKSGRGYSFDVLRAKVLFAPKHPTEGSC